MDVRCKKDVILDNKDEWGVGVSCATAKDLSIVLGFFCAPLDAVLGVIESELAVGKGGALTGKKGEPGGRGLGDAGEPVGGFGVHEEYNEVAHGEALVCGEAKRLDGVGDVFYVAWTGYCGDAGEKWGRGGRRGVMRWKDR